MKLSNQLIMEVQNHNKSILVIELVIQNIEQQRFTFATLGWTVVPQKSLQNWLGQYAGSVFLSKPIRVKLQPKQ